MHLVTSRIGMSRSNIAGLNLKMNGYRIWVVDLISRSVKVIATIVVHAASTCG